MNETNKKSKAITWGKRLVLVALILAGIFYGVLNLAERSKDSIRLGLQDYLSQSTGHNAQITDMKTVELSPDLIFRMDGIFIRDKSDSKMTLVSVDKGYIAMPFLGMVFGQRQYIGFEIRNLKLASGFVLPQKLEIAFAGVSDPTPEKNNPLFLVEGTYNQKPVLITMELSRKTAKKYYLYSLPSFSHITFKIGDVEGSGELEQGFTSLSFNKVQINYKEMLAEFNVTDIEKTPVSTNISGKINNTPIHGLLTKSGENVILSVTPQNENQGVKTFIEAVTKEIGINENKNFEIKILSSEVGLKEEE